MQHVEKVRLRRPFPPGLRRFPLLANIGALHADRAQPLYLLTPAGRFALRATAHRADASLRRAAGRFGPSAQVPTGHALPFAPAGVWGRAPKPYAAAFFVSVASVRRTQETRLSPNTWFFNGLSLRPWAQTFLKLLAEKAGAAGLFRHAKGNAAPRFAQSIYRLKSMVTSSLPRCSMT